MTEFEPIYCPLCRDQLCTSENPVKPGLYFGCRHCGILFRIVMRDEDLSDALRLLAGMPRAQ